MSASQDVIGTLASYVALIGGSAIGAQTFLTLPGARHEHFDIGDSYSAAAFALETSRRRKDVYVRANAQAPGGTKANTVTALSVFTLDFDLAGPGHKAENLPTSPSDMPKVLDAAEVPEPTVVLKTGGGMLAIWALEQVLGIEDETDRARAAMLSDRFQGRIAQAANKLGFHVDHTADLVRACRLPGTRNWKSAYGPDGAPVTVEAWSGVRISLEEVERVAAGWVAPVEPAKKQKKRASRTFEQAESGNCDWAAIYVGCQALRDWADTVEGLLEPQWYALASVVGRTSNGRAEFHELSEQDPRYDEQETEKKLDHALEASPPRLCSSIRDLGGDCVNCPHLGRINSPIALGYVDYRIIELATRFVYVTDANGFVDLHDLRGGQ